MNNFVDNFDLYKNLNEKELPIPVNFEQLARMVVYQNYGMHRFVCALVEASKEKWGKETELASALRAAVSSYTI